MPATGVDETMTTPQITALPPAPTPQDSPEAFNDKAFRVLAAQEAFVEEANELAEFVAQKAGDVSEDAHAASVSASTAADAQLAAENAASTAVAAKNTVQGAIDTLSGIDDELAATQEAAQEAKDIALAAISTAEEAGVTKYADTYADLLQKIGLGQVVNGDYVKVFADEENSGYSSIYAIEAGTPIFKRNVDQLRADLTTFSGAISATPEWSAVPAHEDSNLDAQAQALANRTALLKENQLRTPLHFDTLVDIFDAAPNLAVGQIVKSLYDQMIYDIDADKQPVNGRSIVDVSDYSKIRAYNGRATRLRVKDVTGVYWWHVDGNSDDNGCTVLKDALGRSWVREYKGAALLEWSDLITSDTRSAFENVINCGAKTIRAANNDSTYTIVGTVFIRNDNTTLDLEGSKLFTPTFKAPIFSLSDPNDAAVSPDNVCIKNVRALQTSEVTDIWGETFYHGSQPEDWKVAALVHRGKSVGKTLTLENVYADNFINLVSNWGDWQDESKLSGPLIMRNITTKRINFGLLDNGAEYLEVDTWDDEDRVAIQIAGGGLMPPHTIYTVNHGTLKSGYFIRNIKDRNTIHGSSVKLRAVSKFHISNVTGIDSPSLVELYNCEDGLVSSCNLVSPSDDPSLTTSQAAYAIIGCKNVRWVGCNADILGDRKLVRALDSLETGSLVKNTGCLFEGTATFLGTGYAVMVGSGGGVSFDIAITATESGQIGVLRDMGSTSTALGDFQINVRSVFAVIGSSLVLYFLNAAGGAQIQYNPTTLINIGSISTAGAGNAANIRTVPTGRYFSGGDSNQNIELTSSDTGVVELVASRTGASRRGIISYNMVNNKWEFTTNNSKRAELDVSGFKYALPNSVTLDANRFFGFEAVSNTQVNLVYRGDDGVTRRSPISLS